MIATAMLQKHFVLLVNAPENHSHSNGITVLLAAAKLLRSLGVSVSVVPADSSSPRFTHLPAPFDDLPISWGVPHGCCALIGDTITSELLQQVRDRARQICHFTMAPYGLFRGEGAWGNRIIIKPGERQAVYSPMVSSCLPCFYLQTRFSELDPWIESSLLNARDQRFANKTRRLRASIYAGKGYLRPVPPRLRKLIDRSHSRLITRFEPSSKSSLYQLLSETDFLVCFDPISSLAHEAILMGIPVFIPVQWDEPGISHNFPVRLDGLVWSNLDQFMDLLVYGYDQRAVVESYRSALARNVESLAALLSFAFEDSSPSLSAFDINSYWDSRQPFFASLNLPSPPSAWAPIEAALPPNTFHEYVKALIVVISMVRATWFRRICSRLSCAFRILARGLDRLLPY